MIDLNPAEEGYILSQQTSMIEAIRTGIKW